MNSKFKNKKFRNNRQDNSNAKPRELGKYLHMCEDLVVVKLTTSDIPFPNAQVLNSQKKVIGKVEEVLGPQSEVYAAIKLDSQKEKYGEGDLFYCYENKFIPKERFMVRSEVEKKKEEGDKKRRSDFSKNGGRSRNDFSKGKGDFSKRSDKDNFKRSDFTKNGKDNFKKRDNFRDNSKRFKR